MMHPLHRLEDRVFAQLARLQRIITQQPAHIAIRPSPANRRIFRIFLLLLGFICLLGFLPEGLRVKVLVVLLCVLILATIGILILESLSMRR